MNIPAKWAFKSLWIAVLGIIILKPAWQASQNIPRTDSPGDMHLEQASVQYEAQQYDTAMTSALTAVGIYASDHRWAQWNKALSIAYQCARRANNPATQQRLLPELISAEQLATNQDDIPDSVRAMVTANTGFLQHRLGEYDQALLSYEKAIQPVFAGKDTTLQLKVLGSAAIIYWTQGDDYKALEYHQKALELAEFLADTPMITAIHKNLGNVLRGLNDRQCVQHYQKALAFYPDDAEAAMLLSKALIEILNDTDTALMWAKRAAASAEYDDEKADALHQIGRVFTAKQAHKSALVYYQKALRLAYKGYGKGHPEAEKINVFIARSYTAMNQIPAALTAANQALSALLPGFTPENGYDNPDENDFSRSNLWVLDALVAKSEAFLRSGAQQQEHLPHALACAERSLQYLQWVRMRYGEDESKHAINAYIRPVCETAMHTAFQLYRQSGDVQLLKRAFSMAENIKATTLSETLYHRRIKSLAGIPDDILLKERYYLRRIAYWTKQVYHQPDTTVDGKDSLFWNKRALATMEDDIKKKYPVYAETSRAYRGVVHADSVAARLPEDASLVEYFLGDSTLFTFQISRNSFWADETPIPEHFQTDIAQFRKATGHWKWVNDSTQWCNAVFLHSGFRLFQQLLAQPIKRSQQPRLFIVPDGELNNISFEILPTSDYKGSWVDRDVPFLLKEKSVSYRFSAKSSSAFNGADGQWGGWGLDYDDPSTRGNISQWGQGLRGGGKLPFAGQEIKSVASLFSGGTFWLNKDATREHFIDNAGQFGVLHLAMHGFIDHKDPLKSRLLFAESVAGSDPNVYASDLYRLQLHAGLAVLSSCHSGEGTLQQGEGVMSLSRAFAYAGCPSLVMSLWEVSDQSTEKLMLSFYQYLKDGKTKDEALRLAKIDYLQQASSEYAKPIYWAGFVPIGEMDAFPKHYWETAWYWYVLGAAGLLLLVLAFLLWKRRQS